MELVETTEGRVVARRHGEFRPRAYHFRKRGRTSPEGSFTLVFCRGAVALFGNLWPSGGGVVTGEDGLDEGWFRSAGWRDLCRHFWLAKRWRRDLARWELEVDWLLDLEAVLDYWRKSSVGPASVTLREQVEKQAEWIQGVLRDWDDVRVEGDLIGRLRDLTDAGVSSWQSGDRVPGVGYDPTEAGALVAAQGLFKRDTGRSS